MCTSDFVLEQVVKYVVDNCADDIAFFSKFQDKQLAARLDAVINKPFARVRYEEAIEMLQKEISKDRSKWQFPEVCMHSQSQQAAYSF